MEGLNVVLLLYVINSSTYYNNYDYSSNLTDEPPSILSHPNNESVVVGGNATFSIEAKATQVDLSYQWLRDGSVLKDDDHYRGVTTSCLSITYVSHEHTGQYWCEVSNTAGCVSSKYSQMTVSKLTLPLYSSISFLAIIIDSVL